jgi:branched-chain amino acid transport system permease protein
MTFFSLLVDGVAYGMLLFLLSAGLTVTLGVMRVINLAHSSFAMIGGYFALGALRLGGMPFWAAVLVGVAATIAVSLLLERTLYRWVYKTHALGQLLMTVGLAFILTAVAKNAAGASLQTLPIPAGLNGNWALGSVSVSVYRAFLVVVSLAVGLALWLGFEKTTFGAKLRASVDDPAMARCIGIDVPAVFAVTFVIGCGLAALGGALGSPILPLEPYYGLKYLVLVLIVVAVGGLGSLRGSLFAALLLGLVDTLGRYYIPALGAVIIYLAVLGILLVRPQGLVGRSQ